jgi:GxxExxY protein
MNRQDAKAGKDRPNAKVNLEDTCMDIEELARQVVDSAFQVHNALGPGLLESTYQACMTYELRSRSLHVECEVPQSVQYHEILVDAGYRIDMLVEKCIVIELKCVDQLLPIHEAQILTYMKLGGFHLGFLINWNVRYLKSGIKRMVLDLPEPQWQLDRKRKEKS